jgi:hypothetical protein
MNVQNLFKSLLDKLGRPSDQKSETVAVLVVYCMFLSFSLVTLLGAASVSRFVWSDWFVNQSCPEAPMDRRMAQ